jgi:predicted acetyltransferase
MIGITHLRHRLTDPLRKEGGHIGYNIRPSERRKGYGTKILELALDKAREIGLKRVLVTCDTDNVASGKIIRKNGGVFEGESISDRSGKPVSRYWIELD